MTATTLSNILSKALIIKHLQHSAEGAVVIPVLPAAGYLLCILSAVGRTGINPTLDAAVYLLQFLSVAARTGINPVHTANACNTLIINMLPT